MNEKGYKRRFNFQKEIISRQSERIKSLELQIEELKLECAEKDKIINSVDSLRMELTENVNEIKKYKDEYENLIKELREMKQGINKSVYKSKWNLIKFLIK